MKFDILIMGGTVLDGSGSPAVKADIGIIGDRISAIGSLDGSHAGKIIDATNRHVAPGFIDIHTHSDLSVNSHPEQESILSQGITTQVVGNCSLSVGMATKDAIFEFENRWLAGQGVRIRWKSLDEHLRMVSDNGVATNYVPLAGQGTLRKKVMEMAERKADADDMQRMKVELETAFQAGAWGLSTGLEYTPSRYANIDELAELSKVAGNYGGFYVSHLRNEGDTLIESVAEAIEIGERAGVPVQLSHHKAEGKSNWGKVNRTLEIIEAARERGVDVQLDQYPYTAFQTSLAVQTLPDWANDGDYAAVTSRLDDSTTRGQIKREILASHPDWDSLDSGGYWDSVVIGMCRDNRSIQGRSIGDLSREAGIHPIDTVLEIIRTEKTFVSAVNFAICEEDIATVLRHPLTMIGSDAVGTAPRGKMAEDGIHPRSYGTFPRVLGRYVRELGVIPEAIAIQKMTMLPAKRLGLVDRGLLAIGNFADIVVYDPVTISDRATYVHSHQFSEGIDVVLVNGQEAWEGQARKDVLAGRVLRRNA